jgi:hypothetical protein
MGTLWDVEPADIEAADKAIDRKRRERDRVLQRIREEAAAEVTDLRLKVHDLSVENSRLKRARETEGRAVASATEAYVEMAAALLARGHEPGELFETLSAVLAKHGLKHPKKAAKRLLEIAQGGTTGN